MKDSKGNTTDGLAVSVRNLRKSFKGKMVLREVTFDVREGEVFGIIGPNGAGKTTTLRILSGIITETRETLRSSGSHLRRLSSRDLCRTCRRTPSHTRD